MSACRSSAEPFGTKVVHSVRWKAISQLRTCSCTS